MPEPVNLDAIKDKLRQVDVLSGLLGPAARADFESVCEELAINDVADLVAEVARLRDLNARQVTLVEQARSERDASDGEVERLRTGLERVEGMAERPVCICGVPTGTAAIKQAARAALGPADAQPDPTSAPANTDGSYQARVQPWMMACFGPMIAADVIERHHRFLEEALELVQATGCTRDETHTLVEYVYDRPVGEVAQEVGGVMVTLAALCLAHDLDMHTAGETELARVWTKIEQIRAKQAAKPKHGPLPATST